MSETKSPKQAAYAEAYIAWAYARTLHSSGDVGRAEVARQDARWRVEQDEQDYKNFVRLLELGMSAEMVLFKIARSTG